MDCLASSFLPWAAGAAGGCAGAAPPAGPFSSFLVGSWKRPDAGLCLPRGVEGLALRSLDVPPGSLFAPDTPPPPALGIARLLLNDGLGTLGGLQLVDGGAADVAGRAVALQLQVSRGLTGEKKRGGSELGRWARGTLPLQSLRFIPFSPPPVQSLFPSERCSVACPGGSDRRSSPGGLSPGPPSPAASVASPPPPCG